MEEWRPVASCNGEIEVSSIGRVRRAISRHGNAKVGAMFAVRISNSGYPRVAVRVPGKARMHSVHRLVAEAFIGPCPAGHVVNHIDGVKANSRPENLEYVTPSQNNFHSANLLGTYRGERGNHKLSLVQVDAIRRSPIKQTQAELAAEFGVSVGTIWKIRTNRAWAYGDREIGSTMRAKLNPEAVKVIRSVCSTRPQRGTRVLLARLHGVSKAMISAVAGGHVYDQT